MITRAFIIPTGDEIKNGTVLDLDSAKIMESLVRLNPEMVITRLAPVVDVEANIVGTMESCLDAGAELIVLIGGSGGGHRFSSTLGSDYTHSAMELWLDEKVSHCIYGKNGHMWSKLVCGTKAETLVINVPSRHIAEMGIYPAVDPLESSSRILDPSIVGQEHYEVARRVQECLQRYNELKDIIAILGMDELSEEDQRNEGRNPRHQRPRPDKGGRGYHSRLRRKRAGGPGHPRYKRGNDARAVRAVPSG